MSSSPAVSLCANLESLADHACTAVPTADGALRALVGHVLLQVACQHSLVAQVTLDLLEFTCLQVGLGEGKGWGHVLASEGCVQEEGSHQCPSAVHSSYSPGLCCNTAPSPWRSPCDWQCLGRTAGRREGGGDAASQSEW